MDKANSQLFLLHFFSLHPPRTVILFHRKSTRSTIKFLEKREVVVLQTGKTTTCKHMFGQVLREHSRQHVQWKLLVLLMTKRRKLCFFIPKRGKTACLLEGLLYQISSCRTWWVQSQINLHYIISLLSEYSKVIVPNHLPADLNSLFWV